MIRVVAHSIRHDRLETDLGTLKLRRNYANGINTCLNIVLYWGGIALDRGSSLDELLCE